MRGRVPPRDQIRRWTPRRARSRGAMTQDDKAIGRRVTLEEVAPMAGVSRATVWWVVNGSPKVSPEARRAVEKAIARLGYVPNLSLIHISEPTRLGMISYAVFCLK